jgi:dTMP kinase
VTLPKDGLLITFEGIDGTGKTTQAALLADALIQRYGSDKVVLTRNPGGTPLGSELREILLAQRHTGDAPTPLAELLLYMADRTQHVQQVIRPALAQGCVVICDRFVDSTLAYQGGGRQLSLTMINQLNALACQGVLPHLTLLLDAEPLVLMQRREARGFKDRLEAESLAFQQAVRQQFLILAHENPQRIDVVNAQATTDEVHLAIMRSLIPFLGMASPEGTTRPPASTLTALPTPPSAVTASALRHDARLNV